MAKLAVAGLIMAGAALIVFQIGNSTYGSPQIGQAMALASRSLLNIPFALNPRFPQGSAFGLV